MYGLPSFCMFSRMLQMHSLSNVAQRIDTLSLSNVSERIDTLSLSNVAQRIDSLSLSRMFQRELTLSRTPALEITNTTYNMWMISQLQTEKHNQNFQGVCTSIHKVSNEDIFANVDISNTMTRRSVPDFFLFF